MRLPYDREAAVAYAHRWAFGRNPRYYDFEAIGGDCTNFASQCIYAGSGVMNYTPTYGWYYRSLPDRAPAWTDVEFLYDFLAGARGAGPFGRAVPLSGLLPGDIVQLRLSGSRFGHSPVVVQTDGSGDPGGILVAAHTLDADWRPLSTYSYLELRGVHIEGVRSPG